MKKLVSLLLAMLMVISIVPMASAAELTDSCTITTTGAEYETDGSDALLVDGKYGVAKEPNVTFATGMCAKLTANDTIEYAFTEEKPVSRLDLWIYPAGAVNEYEVQKWDATAQDWAEAPVASGSFAQGISGGSYTVYSPVVFNEAVSAEKLRFVVKSLGAGAAYVSETELHDSNELNMLQLKQFTASNDGNQFFSKYVRGFSVSNNHENSTSAALLGHSWCIWPGWSNSGGAYVTPKSGETTAYYQTKFPGNKVKINRAVVNVKKGSATLIKISYKDTGNEADWTTAKAISGSFTIGNTYTIDIPSSVAANTWRISLEGCDTDFQMGRPDHGTGLYALSEDELNTLEKALAKAVDTAIPEPENIRGNLTLPVSVNFEYKDYDITWSSNSAAVDANTGVVTRTHEDQTATLTASVKEGETNVSVDKVVTVKKDLSLITESDGLSVFGNGITFAYDTQKDEETNVSLLNDKYYFLRADSTGLNVADYEYKFAQFTLPDSGIQFKWDEKRDITRMDLWIYPAGAVNEYEMQVWDEAANDWKTTPVTSGSFAQDVEGGVYANYYPVIFDKVNTYGVRFVIKSLKSGVETAYISEAELSDTNNINMLQMGFFGTDGNKYFSKYVCGFNASANASNNANAYNSQTYKIWGGADNHDGYLITPKSGETTAYYNTTFTGNKVKINCATVNVNKGSATKIIISYKETGTENVWTTAKEISGNFTEGTAVIDIPASVAASKWQISFEGCSSDFRLGRPAQGTGLYALLDSELGLSTTEAALSGALTQGGEISFDIIPDSNVSENAKVFFALYENGQLSSVKPEALALTAYTAANAKYTVPADATGTLSLTAFLLDGTTLVPLLKEPVTK